MLFIFLGSADFINRYYYCVYIAFAIFIITPGRKFYMDKCFAVLVALSVALLIFSPEAHGSLTNAIRPFTYPLCYFMGCNLFNRGEFVEYDLDESQNQITNAIYIVSAGFTIHFLLNMITNYDSTGRNGIDFWSGLPMSATGQATLACFAIAIIAAFLFSNVGKVKKIIAIFLIALIVAYNLVLAGRTLFVLLGVMFLVAFIFRCIATRKIMVNALALTLVIFVAILIVYNANLFGIKTSFENSNFYSRFFGIDATTSIQEDARGQNKIEHLKRFLDHLWGGGKIKADYGHSAHDLYLDTHDNAGIFAFIGVVAYVCISISHGITFVKNKLYTLNVRQLVFCTYVVVNIQFWIEPILKGMPWLFATYCFIDGMVSFSNKKYSVVRNKNI